MRWELPMVAAMLVGAVLGGASGVFAWKQAMPSEAEKQLRADFRRFISTGETARDNWLGEATNAVQGHHNAHILLHRQREIEKWRERLQQALAAQTVLTPEDTTVFVMTTEKDRISGSITALKTLLRDWRSFER